MSFFLTQPPQIHPYLEQGPQGQNAPHSVLSDPYCLIEHGTLLAADPFLFSCGVHSIATN